MARKSNSILDIVTWGAAGAAILLAGNAIFQEANKYKLKGKVCVITGGSRGLGLVLARKLVRKGARVAICARSEDQLATALRELRHRTDEAIAIRADLTERDQAHDMITKVIAHFGRVDVLINNAGTIQVGPMDAMTLEDYEIAMKTNFWAPLYTIHAALASFRQQGGGRIVNISSIGGKVAVPHLLPYSASKFALTGLSEGMHTELKKYNIHVTTIVPHLMRTGSPRNVNVKGDHEAEYALFKFADSSPVLSQEVNAAASRIIGAIEYGESEAILTLTAKLATVAKGIAPGWISGLLSFADRFLPENESEDGLIAKKGYQAESASSRGGVTELTDKAAMENNEM